MSLTAMLTCLLCVCAFCVCSGAMENCQYACCYERAASASKGCTSLSFACCVVVFLLSGGAITYRDTMLLIDPDQSSALIKQRCAKTIAHEIAHMWFGNLVRSTRATRLSELSSSPVIRLFCALRIALVWSVSCRAGDDAMVVDAVAQRRICSLLRELGGGLHLPRLGSHGAVHQRGQGKGGRHAIDSASLQSQLSDRLRCCGCCC